MFRDKKKLSKGKNGNDAKHDYYNTMCLFLSILYLFIFPELSKQPYLHHHQHNEYKSH